MLTKLTDGAIKALVGALKIVLLVVILIALVAWAKANPATAQAALNKVVEAGVAVITWVCDWITQELS
jgi:hypothetical protein